MAEPAGTTWLTVPDLVDLLGISQSRVRRLFDERSLLAVRVDGVLKVPADFLLDGQSLADLRGTRIVPRSGSTCTSTNTAPKACMA